MVVVSAKKWIIDLVAEDCNQDIFFEILYSNDKCIEKNKLFDFILKKTKASSALDDEQKKVTLKTISEIKSDEVEFSLLLSAICKELLRQTKKNLEYENLDDDAYQTLNADIFWPMMVMAMKKCLGANYARETIADKKQYYGLIEEPINRPQKLVHEECIKFFGMNANNFSISNNKELRRYLHPIRSKNKRTKTRSKNLTRVEKTVKKAMQIYRLSHHNIDGNIFSKKRYKVPKQFSHYLRKTYLS